MKKLTLRYEEIVSIYNTLGYIDVAGSVRWKLLISKNLRALKPTMDKLQEKMVFKDEKHTEYLEKRQKLHREFTTDEQGIPITRVTDEKTGAIERVVPMAKQNDWVKASEELREEYKEVFDAMEEHQRNVSKMMSETVEVEVHTIPFAEIPHADNFRQRDFTALSPLFEEEMTEAESK